MITLRGVTFGYREGEPVLRDADLEVDGGLTLLLGPNGCGKSTLLKLSAGVERPHAGCVLVDGLDLWRDEAAARRRLAYVPEQPELTPYATLEEILKLVCRLRGEAPAAARDALERAGLGAQGRRSIRELSLGQRRRALLAAARVGGARALLMDEPLEALDADHRDEILDWLAGRLRSGSLALVATHDLARFAPLAVRAVTLRAGRPLLVQPLPADGEARAALLEELARGGASPQAPPPEPTPDSRRAAPPGSPEGVTWS